MKEGKGKKLNENKLKENDLKEQELKEKELQETERKKWEPFYIISPNRCVISTDAAWDYDQDVTTYVYLLRNDRSKPTHIIAIFKKPETNFGKNMMAIIYARTTRGYVMGEEYYVGSMVLGGSSLFVQVDMDWDPFDGFTIYLVCCPEERAREMKPENESDKRRCGPFTLMC